jgi:hypothetical protein
MYNINDVCKAVDEAQATYNGQAKWEWVDWAGKTLMLKLYAQIQRERKDEEIVQQQAANNERIRAEEEWAEQEAAEQEVEFER